MNLRKMSPSKLTQIPQMLLIKVLMHTVSTRTRVVKVVVMDLQQLLLGQASVEGILANAGTKHVV
jgi:hypothetical protein